MQDSAKKSVKRSAIKRRRLEVETTPTHVSRKYTYSRLTQPSPNTVKMMLDNYMKHKTLKTTELVWSQKIAKASFMNEEQTPTTRERLIDFLKKIESRKREKRTLAEELELLRGLKGKCSPTSKGFDLKIINQMTGLRLRKVFEQLLKLRDDVETLRTMDSNLKEVHFQMIKQADQCKFDFEMKLNGLRGSNSHMRSNLLFLKRNFKPEVYNRVISATERDKAAKKELESHDDVSIKAGELEQLKSEFRRFIDEIRDSEQALQTKAKVVKALNTEFFLQFKGMLLMKEQYYVRRGGPRSYCILVPKQKYSDSSRYLSFYRYFFNQKGIVLVPNEDLALSNCKTLAMLHEDHAISIDTKTRSQENTGFFASNLTQNPTSMKAIPMTTSRQQLQQFIASVKKVKECSRASTSNWAMVDESQEKYNGSNRYFTQDSPVRSFFNEQHETSLQTTMDIETAENTPQTILQILNSLMDEENGSMLLETLDHPDFEHLNRELQELLGQFLEEHQKINEPVSDRPNDIKVEVKLHYPAPTRRQDGLPANLGLLFPSMVKREVSNPGLHLSAVAHLPSQETNCSRNPNNYAVRLDHIIDGKEHLSFFNNINFKLFAHIELFIKNLLYKNAELIHNLLPYTSSEWDKVYGFPNKKKHYNILDTHLTEEDLKTIPANGMTKDDIRTAWVEASVSERKGNQQFSSFILCFGDKDRGMIPNLLRNIYTELRAFNNHIIIMEEVKFRVDILDDRTKGSFTFESFDDVMSFFKTRLSRELYKCLTVITIFFETGSKMMANFSCSNLKKLHIIIVNDREIKDIDLFVVQMRGVLYSNRQVRLLDPVVQRLDYFVRGIENYIVLVEIPSALKMKANAEEKYKRIRNIVEIVARLGKPMERNSRGRPNQLEVFEQLLYDDEQLNQEELAKEALAPAKEPHQQLIDIH